jgi:hypothetical protein
MQLDCIAKGISMGIAPKQSIEKATSMGIDALKKQH